MFHVENAESLEFLKGCPDNSFDAVVTDPPYGLSDHKPKDVLKCLSAWLAGEEYQHKKAGFMSRTWDSWVPGPELWREVYRVLKPGGHMLVFAGSRTQDLMGMALRLAGFEMRDCLQWVYGSGMPKSLNIGKALDKKAGATREVIGTQKLTGNAAQTTKEKGGTYATNTNSIGVKAALVDITAPATEAAKQWDGWGTALKPAYEPILLVRKPLIGTVADNVLEHGVGGINIDGCRIETTDETGRKNISGPYESARTWSTSKTGPQDSTGHGKGRWPANFLHDGSEEVQALFPGNEDDSAARFFYCSKTSKRERNAGCDGLPLGPAPGSKRSAPAEGREAALGAPRENHHPTVKPIALMAYLCRLITPPGGVILDPFTGSGSTGCAAVQEGFHFVGIEMDEKYTEIARARIEHWSTNDDESTDCDSTDYLPE